MKTVHLTAAQIPPALRNGGKEYRAVVTESVTIPADAGLWSEGSRDSYSAVRLADGAHVPFPGQQAAPWDNSRTERRVTLQPGIAVVCASVFCGKHMPLTIYVHPTDAAPMLPGKVELNAIEALVLEYTITRKSSYNGKDRYQMAVDDMRWSSKPRVDRLDRAAWDEAKAALIARGLLNKAGAVTTAGRNAHQR